MINKADKGVETPSETRLREHQFTSETAKIAGSKPKTMTLEALNQRRLNNLKKLKVKNCGSDCYCKNVLELDNEQTCQLPYAKQLMMEMGADKDKMIQALSLDIIKAEDIKTTWAQHKDAFYMKLHLMDKLYPPVNKNLSITGITNDRNIIKDALEYLKKKREREKNS